MKCAVGLFASFILASTPAIAADRFAEICTGTETVWSDLQPARTVPYSLAFSADLVSGHYCYAECRPDQTYRISDARSDPIKLADIHTRIQTREMTFDPRSASLADHHILNVLGRIESMANATCRTSAFREPTPLPGD